MRPPSTRKLDEALTMSSTMFRRLLSVIVLVASTSAPGYAQASLQVPLEFDFLNPGARSLSLGSAFVALADDATAAFTNPAGLTALSRPEVSIEGRGRRIESRFLDRGRLSGPLTNVGIDVISGPQYGTAVDSTFSPTFLSFVYPYRNKFAVAVYRHELTASSDTFRTQGVFQFVPALGADVRETPLAATRDLTVTNYGGAFAYRPTATLTIGGGFSAFHLSLDSTFTRYSASPFTAAATYDPVSSVFETKQSADDNAFGGSIGFLWKPIRQFQLGAVARRGPAFQWQQAVRDLPSGTPAVTAGLFRIPTVIAVGFALRPTDNVTFTFEDTYVDYKALTDDYIAIQAGPSGRQARFVIDANNQVHAGVEYVLTTLPKTPGIRLGYWLDPAHSIVYEAPSTPDLTDSRFAAYLPPETALHHFTFGAGLPISDKLELNIAADLSARRKFYSGLAVLRF
jgi:long-subunit fatty acid transport protein